MTCSTGLETHSPCIIAWKKEHEILTGVPPPPSGTFQHPLLRRIWHRTAKDSGTAATAARALPASRAQAQLRAFSRPSGPGACPDPFFPDPGPTQASLPAQGRPQPRPAVPGPLTAMAPSLSCTLMMLRLPAALRRCRQILPPPRAVPPPSGAPLRHTAVRRFLLAALCPYGGSAAGRCHREVLVMALPVEEWRLCVARRWAALEPALREHLAAASLHDTLRLGCGLLR